MMTQLRDLRHYYLDLPLWACGCRTSGRWSRMRDYLEPDAAPFEAGIRYLYSSCGKTIGQAELDQAVERALQIKAARESDAFACLGSGSLSPRYEIEGLEHLQAAMIHKRPIMLLTGHIGSFYTVSVALAQAGITASSLARSVAPSNPYPRRSFEHTNYFLTGRRMKGDWIYTNYAGKLDRRLVSVCREGGMLVVLLDLPRSLFPAGRWPVNFLGRPSSLTGRTVELGLKYNALFLTAWNTIQVESGYGFRRCLRIEPQLADEGGVDGILQQYADRLTSLVSREPWQWMAAPVAAQFNEGGANE
ncbi:MAG: hypothetical protein WCP10_14355 [Desulfuromonadales bacterium]